MILTVFTPTFNRGDKLFRVYESLKSQNRDDFEWLIVDDGSVDHTEEVVRTFCDENIIKIKYVKQKNGGKHVAYNTALDHAEGEYFFCIDSDDWLQDGFINKFVELTLESKPYGFIAYKRNSSGNLLSDEFPGGLKECSFLDLGEKFYCRGEFSLIIKTDIAKEYKFPVFENEKFIGENVIYDRLSERYKFKLLNQVATVCEYQKDGLTVNYNSLMKRNPSGFCLYYMQRVDLVHGFIQKVGMAGKFHCFKFLSKNDKLKYIGKNKALIFLTRPLGVVFLLYYKLIRGF